MQNIALICARGGSKGLPGKNIRLLGGRPLIGWSIAQARAVPAISRVIVSTDSPEIAEVALQQGAEVPFMRPAELAQDNSPEWHVWRHALDYLRTDMGTYPDSLVVVPATAPLRDVSDIERCLDVFHGGEIDMVITVTQAQRSPYFNMTRLMPDGCAGLLIPPQGRIFRRQDAPEVFDMTTVAYVARPQFVMEHSGIFEGRVQQVLIPHERAIDIDTPLDFRIAQCLLEDKEEKHHG
ncbi:acylneuraminate cytidylyltransferase family protein [Denitratisoma sp. agr-D3]